MTFIIPEKPPVMYRLNSNATLLRLTLKRWTSILAFDSNKHDQTKSRGLIANSKIIFLIFIFCRYETFNNKTLVDLKH